jgi:hypothetical protein
MVSINAALNMTEMLTCQNWNIFLMKEPSEKNNLFTFQLLFLYNFLYEVTLLLCTHRLHRPINWVRCFWVGKQWLKACALILLRKFNLILLHHSNLYNFSIKLKFSFCIFENHSFTHLNHIKFSNDKFIICWKILILFMKHAFFRDRQSD